MDLEHKWAAADLKNDSATIDGILAGNWSAISWKLSSSHRAT